MATVRQKSANSWQLVVSAGYGPDGRQRRIYRTIRFPETMTVNAQRREAQKQANALETDAGRGTITATRKVTLDELFTLYLDAKRETLALSTINNYQWLYNSKIREAFGNVAVQDLTPRRLQRFFSDLSKENAGARSTTGRLSGTSRKHYHTLLRLLCNFAKKLQIITVSPMDAVDAPPNDTPETVFYEPHQIAQLLSCLESEPLIWRCFFTLSVYTGCRPGELIGLDWNDLDGNTITIRAGAVRKDGHTVRTAKPKTKASERIIDLPAEALDLLTLWKIEQDIYKEPFGDSWTTDAVFTTSEGQRMDLSSPTQRFRKIIKKYDLPPITLYGLRHSHASALISSGLDVRSVAGRLGHSQTSTTLNIYSHQFASANSAATAAITKAIADARENQKKSE